MQFISDMDDAIHLRYGWRPQHLSKLSPCGASFTVDDALNCYKVGFISIRHNEFQDFFGQLLDKVYMMFRLSPLYSP